jgi:hypothetical protein
MNFQTITNIAGQRQTELRSQAAECRRAPGRTIPRWRLSWSRAKLPGDRLSVVLVITVTRLAAQPISDRVR